MNSRLLERSSPTRTTENQGLGGVWQCQTRTGFCRGFNSNWYGKAEASQRACPDQGLSHCRCLKLSDQTYNYNKARAFSIFCRTA
ncbi:hypothetical protein H6G89_11775 [Oscillatoria sp. FACHB-1407]|uniref:hypothetical protein n=1 Tax=Oscillatoria sp. FACHB-1407 TaxID=2692847 RepID=UPI0016841C2D|nr:hypothetical protein [Oscillatoria sp. FACHB-1407]MBD2461731.1 hypothetical protein [Oscillatoria sp. FACHB-1407]